MSKNDLSVPPIDPHLSMCLGCALCDMSFFLEHGGLGGLSLNGTFVFFDCLHQLVHGHCLCRLVSAMLMHLVGQMISLHSDASKITVFDCFVGFEIFHPLNILDVVVVHVYPVIQRHQLVGL